MRSQLSSGGLIILDYFKVKNSILTGQEVGNQTEDKVAEPADNARVDHRARVRVGRTDVDDLPVGDDPMDVNDRSHGRLGRRAPLLRHCWTIMVAGVGKTLLLHCRRLARGRTAFGSLQTSL